MPALQRDEAPAVEIRTVVGRGILGGVTTDTSRTPLAGATHTAAGPATEGADYPSGGTASPGSRCKLTELQHDTPLRVRFPGSGHGCGAHEAPNKTVETAENRISGTEEPSQPSRKPLAPTDTRLSGEIGGIPLFPVVGPKPSVGAQGCPLGVNDSLGVKHSQSAEIFQR